MNIEERPFHIYKIMQHLFTPVSLGDLALDIFIDTHTSVVMISEDY